MDTEKIMALIKGLLDFGYETYASGEKEQRQILAMVIELIEILRGAEDARMVKD